MELALAAEVLTQPFQSAVANRLGYTFLAARTDLSQLAFVSTKKHKQEQKNNKTLAVCPANPANGGVTHLWKAGSANYVPLSTLVDWRTHHFAALCRPSRWVGVIT